MNKVLFFLCFMTASLSLAEENKPFVYKDNAKKNPFDALVSLEGTVVGGNSESLSVNIRVEGIIVDAKNHNLAIIDGKVVKVGDQISSYTVSAISVNAVELVKGQEHLIIKMKKGDT